MAQNEDKKMSKAIDDISAERQRQVRAEGWTPEHDDTHDGEELARAAVSYAMPWSLRGRTGMPDEWPWDSEWWKPNHSNRRRELVKAGALIVAEIERLDRK
jgi:hypothetical protein